MRIVCLSCAAVYEVADGLLTRSRTVRCSRCAREWVQNPAHPVRAAELPANAQLHAPEPPSAIEPVEPMPAPAALVPEPLPVPEPQVVPPRPDSGGAGLKLAWLASVVAVVALAFVVYRYRVEIQAAWPPSARLFRLLPA